MTKKNEKFPRPELVRSMVFDPPVEHPLVTFGESDDFDQVPELVSVGMYHIPDSKNFVAFKMVSKGGQVLKLEVEEPNLRAIAEESAKIFFVREFMDDKF